MMETSLEFVIIVELSIIQKNHITKYEKGIFAAESVIQNIVQKYFLKKNKTPGKDPEKEELAKKIEELEARLYERENTQNTAEEQLALLEKSYELAAKYMNGGQEQAVKQVTPTAPIQGKVQALPVKAITETTVSGLQTPMSDAEFIAAYSQPRNFGFNTAVGTGASMGKNTILACIHEDQSVIY